ncbi:MAG: hypothetical protein J5662_00605, partial [Clostridia bacterium]|nr:hypothetical protein [Clostridia bacterium]
GGGITTTFAGFVNKDDNIFVRGEKQVIRLKWINDTDVKDLCFRAEILTRYRAPIGAAVIYDFYSGKKGETGHAEFVLSTDSLAQGQYSMNFSFFTKSEFGNNVNLDYVKGLNFNVTRSVKDIIWDKKKWGNVRFADIKLFGSADK